MKVLVAFGSKLGGTQGIASTIGTSFETAGDDVDVMAAGDVRSVDGYDIVIVGGALYAGRWHKDARRMVRRHQVGLRTKPVWLFSSGPLDDSAAGGDIPPTGQVRKLLAMVEAQGHMTFGGRLEPDARGFPATAMARSVSGDWRDQGQIERWAKMIREEALAG